MAPGLTALTRIVLSLRSIVQERANERIAALVAWYTLRPSAPLDVPIEAFKMIEPPSRKIGRAFCTVNRSPFTLILNNLWMCSSVIFPNGANCMIPAFANRMSI